jgi:hypothetical protein
VWFSIIYKMGVVYIRVARELVGFVGKEVGRVESKALLPQHVDEWNTYKQPNSWACAVSLENSLKGNLDTTVQCG